MEHALIRLIVLTGVHEEQACALLAFEANTEELREIGFSSRVVVIEVDKEGEATLAVPRQLGGVVEGACGSTKSKWLRTCSPVA